MYSLTGQCCQQTQTEFSLLLIHTTAYLAKQFQYSILDTHFYIHICAKIANSCTKSNGTKMRSLQKTPLI